MTQTLDTEFATRVTSQLAAIEDALLVAAVADNPLVDQAAKHVIEAGGKRFRPQLVVLCSAFGPQVDQQRLISAALVVELTHVASLYHDDVMDEAELRRGVDSANARFGNSIAILVGDYLFARASSQVSTLGVDYVTLQAETFARLVQGQVAETLPRPDGVDPVDHYLALLADKTGSLIATSAVFGGMVSGAGPEILDSLRDFGEQIGVVFQLSDDLIDISSDETGKMPGTDLRAGVPTLPVLLLEAAPGEQALKALIAAGHTDPRAAAQAVVALRQHPVMDQARELIRQRADAARDCLAPLPEGPAKRALSRLCDEVVLRSA